LYYPSRNERGHNHRIKNSVIEVEREIYYER
jgi:hypothetical protein